MITTKQIKYKNQNGQEEIINFAVNAQNVEELNFVEATERGNIEPRDGMLGIFGKIKKWYKDLKPIAWSGSYNDLANKPTLSTLTGTVPIAKGGTGATVASAARTNLGLGAASTYAVANNDTTNNAAYLATAAVAYQHGREIDKINSDLGNCKLSYENGSFYAATGSVKKKLGEAGLASIYTKDVAGHSSNFRGYSNGWIDYNIPAVTGYTFVGGFIKYFSVSNSNANLQKMNVEIQKPSAGVLRVLPVA